jgi:hypothetical protein
MIAIIIFIIFVIIIIVDDIMITATATAETDRFFHCERSADIGRGRWCGGFKLRGSSDRRVIRHFELFLLAGRFIVV